MPRDVSSSVSSCGIRRAPWPTIRSRRSPFLAAGDITAKDFANELTVLRRQEREEHRVRMGTTSSPFGGREEVIGHDGTGWQASSSSSPSAVSPSPNEPGPDTADGVEDELPVYVPRDLDVDLRTVIFTVNSRWSNTRPTSRARQSRPMRTRHCVIGAADGRSYGVPAGDAGSQDRGFSGRRRPARS